MEKKTIVRLNHRKLLIYSLIEALIVALPLYVVVSIFGVENGWVALFFVVWGYGYILARHVIPTSPIYRSNDIESFIIRD